MIGMGFEIDENVVKDAESAIKNIVNISDDVVTAFTDGMSDSFSEMKQESLDAVANTVGSINKLKSEYEGVQDVVSNVGSELANVSNSQNAVTSNAHNIKSGYQEIAAKVNLVKAGINKLRQAQKAVATTVNSTVKKYPALGLAANKVGSIIKKVKSIQDKFKKSVKDTGNEYTEVGDKVNSLKSKLMGVVGALGVGIGLAQMNELTEEFTKINETIGNATDGMGEQREIQEKILNSANDTRTSYADTAKVVSNLVKENKDLFGTIDEAIAFNDSATKLFKTAGKSNDEIAALMESINKSYAKGAVDSETVSQLLEQSPEAVALLNKRLGSTTDQLEQMATDGKISLSDLKEAFVGNSEEINAKFGNLSYNLSDAMISIRNKWGFWLADINKATSFTQTLAKIAMRTSDVIMNGLNKVRDIIVKLSDKFGGIENVLKFVAIAAGAIFLALNAGKILSFLKGMTALLNVANLKILALIAVFIIIALIVEDFINFLQGNDSVIGQILEKLGYNSEEVREKVIAALTKIKEFFIGVANSLREIVSNLVQALTEFWEEWGDEIIQAVRIAIDTVIKVFQDFLAFAQGFITFIKGILNGDMGQIMEGLKQMWDANLQYIKDIFMGIFNIIYTFFGDKIDAMVEKVKGFVDKIKEMAGAVGDFFGGIGDFFGGIGDFVTGGSKADVKNTTVANSTGTGNKTNNVNQTVEIKQTFNGTDQQTISNASTKAADDTTTQLARGLAYGR